MWLVLTIAGTAAAAAGGTFGLRRLGLPLWASAALAGLVPAILILACFFYLESLQPVGPYYALIGLFFGAVSLAVGLAAATVLALILWQTEDRTPAP